ncbi:MAG: helix-turn-helix domain-containing protein [Turicibacter sp.]|nr:helix-turn-helix domain-containing protein [Turicibacter sp.]
MQNAKMMSGSTLTQFQLTQNLLNNLSQFNITPTAKLVLLYLSSCYNPKKAGMFPKQKTMSEKIGISERSIIRAVSELISEGLIIVECKYSNKYHFTSKIVCVPPENENFFTSAKMSDTKCQNGIKENAKMSLPYIEPKKEHKKEPTTNVVVLNQIPDIIKTNKRIRDIGAYWTSLSDKVKQEYIQKDLQLKEKARKQQAALERIRQRELQAEKERQDLIAECSKPLSVQYDYDTALKIVQRLAKFDKSCLNKPFPQELIKTFNIKL